MKTIIDNSYLINEFGYDIAANLKDLPHMVEDKFINIVYDSVCDFIIENNRYINSNDDVENYLDNQFKKDTFKRCQAIQAIYVLENGDARFVYGEEINIAPAVEKLVKDSLKLFQRMRFIK